MKNSSVYLILGMVFMAGLASCTTPSATTVVSQLPATIDPATPPGQSDGNFNVLRYGELDQIRSLDPLFALNSASQRVVQMIHDGLTGLDEYGRVQPRIAASWTVSSDSLEWTFKLRSDIFFHDARVFTNGVGRRVTSADVREAFLRMAGQGVPPNAAQLYLETVRGFDAYFKEQHQVYFAQDRIIQDISGIRTPDDETVVFQLYKPDPHFLNKLAAPLSVIYPVEAYAAKTTEHGGTPVGTGAYRFERAYGDTLIILEKNRKHWNSASSGTADRIEVVNQRLESELFKKFAREEIDFIAELGPEMVRTLLTENGQLEPNYAQNYALVEQRAQEYSLFFNKENAYGFTREDVLYLLRSVNLNQYAEQMGVAAQILNTIPEMPQDYYAVRVVNFDTTAHVLNMGYNGNLIAGDFLLNLSRRDHLAYPVRIYRTPIINRELLMYVDQPGTYVPLPEIVIPDSLYIRDPQLMARFSVKRYAIVNRNVSGIRLNALPWWLDVSGVTIREDD